MHLTETHQKVKWHKSISLTLHQHGIVAQSPIDNHLLLRSVWPFDRALCMRTYETNYDETYHSVVIINCCFQLTSMTILNIVIQFVFQRCFPTNITTSHIPHIMYT